jgi:hypothetical protein
MRPYGLMNSNSRLLESKGHFPASARHLPGKKRAQGKNRAPDKEKGRREEVPAFSCYEPAGGGAGWSPRGAEGGGSTRRAFLDSCHHTPDRFLRKCDLLLHLQIMRKC